MDIKKYLGYVLELEKELYTIENIINNLSEQSRKLGIKKEFQEPFYVNGDRRPTIGECLFWGVPIGIVGVVLFFIIGTIGNSFFNGDFTFATLGWALLISCIIGVCIGYFWERQTIKDGAELYAENMQKYKEAINIDKMRVTKELKQKGELNGQIDMLQKRKKETINTLQRLYGANIIYYKYRNFIAVATMYEYFDSGRCKTLEGHEGAYNVYENELRLNHIVSQLTDIIYRLDDIKDAQVMVYNAIKEGNRLSGEICNNSARLLQQNQEIMENTALAAYNSRIVATNTEIMKFISLYM